MIKLHQKIVYFTYIIVLKSAFCKTLQTIFYFRKNIINKILFSFNLKLQNILKVVKNYFF
jgi:hypothetical protein